MLNWSLAHLHAKYAADSGQHGILAPKPHGVAHNIRAGQFSGRNHLINGGSGPWHQDNQVTRSKVVGLMKAAGQGLGPGILGIGHGKNLMHFVPLSA